MKPTIGSLGMISQMIEPATELTVGDHKTAGRFPKDQLLVLHRSRVLMTREIRKTEEINRITNSNMANTRGTTGITNLTTHMEITITTRGIGGKARTKFKGVTIMTEITTALRNTGMLTMTTTGK